MNILPIFYDEKNFPCFEMDTRGWAALLHSETLSRSTRFVFSLALLFSFLPIGPLRMGTGEYEKEENCLYVYWEIGKFVLGVIFLPG